MEFYNKLKVGPFKLFGKFNPLFKTIVVLLSLTMFLPDPLDLIGLGIWGLLGTIFTQKAVVGGVLIVMGVVGWLIIQIIEALLLGVFLTYLVPGIVGFACTILETDPNPVIFKTNKAKAANPPQ